MAKKSQKEATLPILQKCPTGIQGLDEITGGGLPKGLERRDTLRHITFGERRVQVAAMDGELRHVVAGKFPGWFRIDVLAVAVVEAVFACGNRDLGQRLFQAERAQFARGVRQDIDADTDRLEFRRGLEHTAGDAGAGDQLEPLPRPLDRGHDADIGRAGGQPVGALGGHGEAKVYQVALRTVLEMVTGEKVENLFDHAEVVPVRELDGRTIGRGTRGPITEKLQALYFDVVHGRSHQHLEWLTPV